MLRFRFMWCRVRRSSLRVLRQRQQATWDLLDQFDWWTGRTNISWEQCAELLADLAVERARERVLAVQGWHRIPF